MKSAAKKNVDDVAGWTNKECRVGMAKRRFNAANHIESAFKRTRN